MRSTLDVFVVIGARLFAQGLTVSTTAISFSLTLPPALSVFRSGQTHQYRCKPFCRPSVQIFFYVDLRWDTSKVLFHQSRPVPEGAQDIGAWLMVFECLSYLSTVTNLTIVVFTNTNPLFDFNWSWSERLTFFVICEHVVLLLKYALASWIPDVAFPTRIQVCIASNYVCRVRVSCV